jgi:hypothetical protein
MSQRRTSFNIPGDRPGGGVEPRVFEPDEGTTAEVKHQGGTFYEVVFKDSRGVPLPARTVDGGPTSVGVVIVEGLRKAHRGQMP